MNRSDLMRHIQALGSSPSEAKMIVDTIFDSMSKALNRGEPIEIRGFGSFRMRRRAGRVVRNPRTNAQVVVPLNKDGSVQTGKGIAADRQSHEVSPLS